MSSRAEEVLVGFVTSRGGSAAVMDLAPLFSEQPWFSKAVGRLQDFCGMSSCLKYLARDCQNRATVCLTLLPSPSGACWQDAEAQTSKDVADVYRPRSMSRKVLKAQLRAGIRSCPMGFNPRSRSVRSKQAKAWLHSFLEVQKLFLKARTSWPQYVGGLQMMLMRGACVRV